MNSQQNLGDVPAPNGTRLPSNHPARRWRASPKDVYAIGSIALAYAVGIGAMQMSSGAEADAAAPRTVASTTRDATAPGSTPTAVGRPTLAMPAPAPVRAARAEGAVTSRAPQPTETKRAKRAKKATSAKAVWAQARARHRPLWTAQPHPVRDVDCLHLKCIALTFDDGPEPGTTDRLLEILAREHVRATFFVVGKKVAADPGPLIRAAWDGHEIGIHTWSHRTLRGRSTAALAEDIARTSAVVARYSGFVPQTVRPPFGAIDDSAAARIPYPLMLWSVDPFDWRDQSRVTIHERVTAGAAPGSVVVLHDVYRPSVDAVPKLIAHYRKRGYTFVGVSELFSHELRPHRVYRGRELEVARARAADRAAGRVREPYVSPELRVEPDATPQQPSPTPTPAATPTPTPTPTPTSTPAPEHSGLPWVEPNAPGRRPHG